MSLNCVYLGHTTASYENTDWFYSKHVISTTENYKAQYNIWGKKKINKYMVVEMIMICKNKEKTKMTESLCNSSVYTVGHR